MPVFFILYKNSQIILRTTTNSMIKYLLILIIKQDVFMIRVIEFTFNNPNDDQIEDTVIQGILHQQSTVKMSDSLANHNFVLECTKTGKITPMSFSFMASNFNYLGKYTDNPLYESSRFLTPDEYNEFTIARLEKLRACPLTNGSAGSSSSLKRIEGNFTIS